MSNDLDVVLDAAALLAGKNIQMVLLGDGKEKPALQRRAAGLQLHNVTFAPSVPKSEMPGALAAADACIAILRPIGRVQDNLSEQGLRLHGGRPAGRAGHRRRDPGSGAGCRMRHLCKARRPAALADAICSLANDPARGRAWG